MVGLAHTGEIDSGFPRKTLGFNSTHAHDREGADLQCRNVLFFKAHFYAEGYFDLPDDPELIILAATVLPGREKDRAILATEPFDTLEKRKCDYTISYGAFKTLRKRRSPAKENITVGPDGERRIDVCDLAIDRADYDQGRNGLFD